MKPVQKKLNVAREILEHYETGPERTRLFVDAQGQIERLRTEEILARYVSKKKLNILDVGGGMGVYALPLARQGHRVTLIDPVPLHIKTAQRLSQKQKRHPLHSISLGDTRRLEFPKNEFDVVLILGPLYHLIKRRDRLQALREAHRVLKPGGLLVVAAVSRYASLMDGIVRNYLADRRFQAIVWKDLETGQHENPTNEPNWFTTAFLHRPHELRDEVKATGFKKVTLHALEGPAWLAPNIDQRWKNKTSRRLILEALRKIEQHEDIVGLSAHFLAIGRK